MRDALLLSKGSTSVYLPLTETCVLSANNSDQILHPSSRILGASMYSGDVMTPGSLN